MGAVAMILLFLGGFLSLDFGSDRGAHGAHFAQRPLGAFSRRGSDPKRVALLHMKVELTTSKTSPGAELHPFEEAQNYG
jgi:hypothetical protein